MAKKSSGNTIGLSMPTDWQAQSDLDTMLRSEEIEADSKRLAAVQALAKKKMMDMAAIAKEGPND